MPTFHGINCFDKEEQTIWIHTQMRPKPDPNILHKDEDETERQKHHFFQIIVQQPEEKKNYCVRVSR